MIIRTAQISDIKAILPLMEQLEYPQDSETMSIILRNYLNMKFHKIFVAEIDSRVSGLISIAGVCSLVYDAMIYRITSLIVDKNHRRKSIGQQLMMEAEKFAKNNDGKVIDLTSGLRRSKDGTHEFYKSLGYENDGYMAKLYLRKEI
jgi:ribosomal protein S18 acetylase RimI-like enzyme